MRLFSGLGVLNFSDSGTLSYIYISFFFFFLNLTGRLCPPLLPVTVLPKNSDLFHFGPDDALAQDLTFSVNSLSNNLDQEIKDHISSSSNPGTIKRTSRVQTCAIQQVLSLVTKAERSVDATRRLVSASTELVLHANNVVLYGQVAADKVVATIFDGAASATSSITATTGRIPTFASQVERTLPSTPPGATSDVDFVWEPGNCFGCNSKNHK